MSIRELAKYIGKHESTLYHMRKTNPKQFELLWLGWTIHNQLEQSKKRQKELICY